uniref:TcC31.27 n=1 Tax=Trypanosoma cruzi TaxID=5693 RepID=O61102_TRYCR|nr:TcC31.27 [Trypanosoma cruzi]
MHVCTLARWRVRPGGGGGAAVFYLLHRGGHRSSLAARACSTRSEWPAWMRARRGSRGGLPPVRFFFFFWVVGDLRIIFVHCRFPERLIFYFYFWLLADVAAPLAALCGGVTGVLPPCPPFMWRSTKCLLLFLFLLLFSATPPSLLVSLFVLLGVPQSSPIYAAANGVVTMMGRYRQHPHGALIISQEKHTHKEKYMNVFEGRFFVFVSMLPSPSAHLCVSCGLCLATVSPTPSFSSSRSLLFSLLFSTMVRVPTFTTTPKRK